MSETSAADSRRAVRTRWLALAHDIWTGCLVVIAVSMLVLVFRRPDVDEVTIGGVAYRTSVDEDGTVKFKPVRVHLDAGDTYQVRLTTSGTYQVTSLKNPDAIRATSEHGPVVYFADGCIKQRFYPTANGANSRWMVLDPKDLNVLWGDSTTDPDSLHARLHHEPVCPMGNDCAGPVYKLDSTK